MVTAPLLSNCEATLGLVLAPGEWLSNAILAFELKASPMSRNARSYLASSGTEGHGRARKRARSSHGSLTPGGSG